MSDVSPVRTTGAKPKARYAREVAYRSNDHVLEAARAEERELAALGRDSRMRRARAATVLVALLITALAAPALAARLPSPHTPSLHCHRVTVQYEQPVGTPPPPLSWQVCELR
jgi:hypothetical protein